MELFKYVVRHQNKTDLGHDWFPILAADEVNALAGVERQGLVVERAVLLAEVEIDSISDARERDSLRGLKEAPPERWARVA
jgi:hypothetical protein